MNEQPLVHRFPVQQEGAFVNAYLVETQAGVVAVDSLLTVSESRAMRRALERIGKPLQAVLLTQSHPDHYAGLTQLVAEDDVPIFAPQGVIDTIIRDDAAKDAIVGPMFGDEWPGTRIFPNTPVLDGERVTFDEVEFTVIDLGPGESPHDGPWVLGADATTVFLGDQIYDRRHSYLADGFHREWLENLEQLRARFSDDVVFHIGHGGPVRPADFDWQRDYIETFVGTVEGADWSRPDVAHSAVVAEMKRFLPTNELQFLMELSVDPIAEQLGLLAAA
jgi:glyoxylase-like metal-dependent hydrolase (beta-lactamase superfamily II)